MASVSIFHNFTIKVEDTSLNKILKDIESEKFRDQIELIRKYVSEGNNQEADRRKKLLPGFTASGTFNGGRKSINLLQYNGHVILDFDKLNSDQLDQAFAKIKSIPYTRAAFISPSGNGIKVIVPVDTDQDFHTIAYMQVCDFYSKYLDIVADMSGKDICRLCFMSFDPGCFSNPNAYRYHIDVNLKDEVNKESIPPLLQQVDSNETISDLDWESTFVNCKSFTDRKSQYIEGNRNNYIHLLACNCNRVGIPEDVTTYMILKSFDLNINEVTASIKSAYRNNISDFGKNEKFAKSAKLQSVNQENNMEDALKLTPVINPEIFESLPMILQKGCNAFTDTRKRDVFFTAALAIVSGCLPKVTGVYFNERLHPHLFVFIIAPPASGKGVLKNARKLADKYHEQVLRASKEAQKDYEKEIFDIKEAQKCRKKNEILEHTQPEKPPFKIVFIPANCSASRMIEHLQNNDGIGIICESEADTMSGTKKQDWGDYSPHLRAAFHHETITYTRKTNNEYIEIKNPCLAVALTGTPGQAPRLISSSEDGLFSRFLFYAFKSDIVWQDPSPINQSIVYNDHFGELSEDMMKIIALLEMSPTEVSLTLEQWNTLNFVFSDILDDVVAFTGEDAASIVYRLGLISFRICMVFSALRKTENAQADLNIICTDIDFKNAISLVKTYLNHSILMYNNLPEQQTASKFAKGDKKIAFLNALPNEFTTKEAGEVAANFKLSYSSISKMLPKMVPEYFTQPKAGYYIKNAIN